MDFISHNYFLLIGVRFFEPILNYLRTGEIIYEKNLDPKGILIEAEYFGIHELAVKFHEIVANSNLAEENTPLR